MRKKSIFSLMIVVTCSVSLLSGCGNEDNKDNQAAEKTEEQSAEQNSTEGHEPVTILSCFQGMGQFIDVLNEKYPEINLEVIPYSGQNMTAYVRDELSTNNMPDIYTTTMYFPGQEDLSDRLIDISSYDFTSNYAEARLRDVSDNGAIYLLPTYYSCLGITYNKTLLEKHGWTLPTTLAELEELAPKVEEAGCNLALNQLSLPGYGFQYFCNVMDTDFLNTIEGRQWQRDFLNSKTNVRDSAEMMKSLSTLEKWKELGLLNGNSDSGADSDVKAEMAEGNTLFMLGGTNNFTKEDSDDEFGLMPYLSEDGTQNALILNIGRYVGLNKQLEEEGNEQKLEDATHVLEVLSSVEGMAALTSGYEDSTLLPLQDYTIPETSYYKQIEDDLNSGMTAPFIYAGWDNLIVPIGETMLDYIRDDATLDDVIQTFDDNQILLKDDESITITTTTEELDTDACAKLVGISFGKASGADLALVSKNKWYKSANGYGALNLYGVSGSLFPMGIKDQEIVSILPTGWRRNIETVTLTGKRIEELMESGYEMGDLSYPYELVTPKDMEIEDDTTYTVAICGVSDDVAKEGNLTDTGILGLDAATEYLSQFKTLSESDLVWE